MVVFREEVGDLECRRDEIFAIEIAIEDLTIKLSKTEDAAEAEEIEREIYELEQDLLYV